MRRTRILTTLMGAAAIAALTGAPARADSAKDNYTAFCAKCHGPDGRGDGPSAGSLATKPQDYTNCAAMQKISDDTMFKVIKGGGAAVGLPADMPSWSDGLSDPEIHDLVAFVRTFCKKK
jgi:cytochrome c553